MKNIYLLCIAFLASSGITAQVSTFPYTEGFSRNSALTGWTVDANSIWYHDTALGVIRADDDVQTGYYWNLYSPWFNTSQLAHPVMIFYMAVIDSTPSACVPELDFEYDDGSGNGYQVIRHISTGSFCSPNDYDINNRQVAYILTQLSPSSSIRYVFNGNFVGLGSLFIDSVYVGEMPASSGIIDVSPINISIAPNPVIDRMDVSFNVKESALTQLYLTDMLGKRVLREPDFIASGLVSKTINVRNLNTGIYILNVFTNGILSAKKVVVSH